MKLLIFLWKLWYYLLNFIVILLIAPTVLACSYLTKSYSTIYSLLRLWAKIIFYGMGMRYKLTSNVEISPTKNYIFISNHTSMLDVMLMLMLHPKHPLAFVGKKELSKIPLFGSVYKKTCVLVDRDSTKSRAKVYKLSMEKIALGRSMVIFPEGGVFEEEVLLHPFKDGAFAIAKEVQVPIAVYVFEGAKEAFPFNFRKGKPSKINVYLESIIEVEDINNSSKQEIKEHAYQLILKRLKKTLLKNKPE